MQEKDKDITLALVDGTKSTFNKLHVSTKISKRILRKHLDELIKKNLVKEEGRKQFQKHRNMSLEYSLTDKGREHLVYSSASETLILLKEILDSLDPLKMPRVFDELRRYIDAIEIKNFEKILNKIRKEGVLSASSNGGGK